MTEEKPEEEELSVGAPAAEAATARTTLRSSSCKFVSAAAAPGAPGAPRQAVMDFKAALVGESDPSWEPMEGMDRAELRHVLSRLLTEGSLRLSCPDVESSESFVNNFGRFCARRVEHPLGGGVAGLAEDLNSSVPEHFSIAILTALLGGDSGDHFPFAHLGNLLLGLDVPWDSYEHLGDVACSLMTWPECNSEPELVGRLFRSLVFPSCAAAAAETEPPGDDGNAEQAAAAEDDFFATEDVVDVMYTVLGDDWEPQLVGKIIKGMLPCWHEERVQDILQHAVGRWMDEGGLNSLRLFEVWDTQSSQNKAYYLGTVIDSLDMPEASALRFSVQFLQWFWANFEEADQPVVGDPPLVCCMRGSWFAGRLLQQLSVCHDPEYIELGTRPWFGGSWSVQAAQDLARRLTAADGSSDPSVEPSASASAEQPPYDWRYDRSRHAFSIGAVLFQLRERWWSAELTSLIQGLRKPSEGPPVPGRIMAEVLEGLNADWDVRLPRLQPLERSFWLQHHADKEAGRGGAGAGGRAGGAATVRAAAAALSPPSPDALRNGTDAGTPAAAEKSGDALR